MLFNEIGVAITKGDFKASETVCYGDLGCFTTAEPVRKIRLFNYYSLNYNWFQFYSGHLPFGLCMFHVLTTNCFNIC
jgi:hypothetical protein